MARSRWVGKTIAAVVVLALAGGGTWWYLRGEGEPAPRFQTVAVQRGPVTQVVTAAGQLEPVVSVDVSSQISGRIQDVLVDYNTPVKKGDVLARIDPATFQSLVVQAENELLNARANLRLVRANAARSRRLFDQNLLSQADLDQIDAQLEQAEVEIRIREAALDSRKTDLSRCTLYAPIDGIVIDRLTEVGRMVAASLNAPTLFTIANDLTKMQINAAVAEADIGNVQVGQAVDFTVDAFPNDHFHGRVEQIRNLPVTQQNVVVYATIIEVSNERMRLKPGMTANVSIVVERRDNVLKIPNAALRVRVPETWLTVRNDTAAPASAPAGGARRDGKAGGGQAAGAGDSREQFRALLREAGFEPGGGPPSPEVLARARQLAAERGIEVPERFGGGGGSGGGAGGAPVITRTVFRVTNATPRPEIVPVTVKLGITDGIFTEVIDGLGENDAIVSSVTATAGGPAGNSPFGGGFPRRF